MSQPDEYTSNPPDEPRQAWERVEAALGVLALKVLMVQADTQALRGELAKFRAEMGAQYNAPAPRFPALGGG